MDLLESMEDIPTTIYNNGLENLSIKIGEPYSLRCLHRGETFG